jgi:methionine sulfoxide reductase heme-binding subunit
VSHLVHSHLIWYLNRSTGVVLVAVLTLSTALGVLSTRGGSTRWPRFALQSLHRNVSLIACALLLAHTVTPVIDTYVNHYAPIAVLDAVVPFVSAYEPLALGLGTLALDLLVVVVVTSVARQRLGHRTWFGVHLLTYASWALGVVHGLLIGTDAWTTWNLAVTGTSVAVVLAAVVARLLRRGAPQPAVRLAAEPEPWQNADPVARRSRRSAPEPFPPPETEPFLPPETETFLPPETETFLPPETETFLPPDTAPPRVRAEAANRHGRRRASA